MEGKTSDEDPITYTEHTNETTYSSVYSARFQLPTTDDYCTLS